MQRDHDDVFNLSMTELLLIIMFALLVAMVMLNSNLISERQANLAATEQTAELASEVNRIAEQLGLETGQMGQSPIDITTALAQMQSLVEQLDKATSSDEAQQVLNTVPLDQVWSTLTQLINSGEGYDVSAVLQQLEALKQQLSTMEKHNQELVASESETQTLIEQLTAQLREAESLNEELAEIQIETEAMHDQLRQKLVDTDHRNQELLAISQETQGIQQKLKVFQQENEVLKSNKGALVAQLNNVIGRGSVYPPCWIDSDSHKPQYTLMVKVTDNRIDIQNIFPQDRMDQYLAITNGVNFDGRQLSPDEFRLKMDSFLTFSQQQTPECRFFVKVIDGTSHNAKDEWKRGLASVESAFYKLLL